MAYEMVMPYHLHMPVYQSTERHATGGMLMVPEEKNN